MEVGGEVEVGWGWGGVRGWGGVGWVGWGWGGKEVLYLRDESNLRKLPKEEELEAEKKRG